MEGLGKDEYKYKTKQTLNKLEDLGGSSTNEFFSILSTISAPMWGGTLAKLKNRMFDEPLAGAPRSRDRGLSSIETFLCRIVHQFQFQGHPIEMDV